MLKRVLALLMCLFLAAPTWAAQEYLLTDIVIKGTKRVQTADVLNAIKIKPGQTVSTADIDEAMAEIYAMERFEDIAADITEEAGGSTLVFKVDERPLVRRIRFEGNEELSTEKLREVITVKTPDIYDPFEVSRSVDMIKGEYSKEGYYAAEVIADSHVDEDNETLVTFRIKEGDIVRIKDIRFEGNTVFDAGDLEDVMETREKWIFSWITGRGNYNEEMLNFDLERIADLYFNEGYVRVKVNEPVISLVDDNKHMLLLIHVDEGPQYKVGNIDVQGDMIREKEELLSMVSLAPGDVFSRAMLRSSVGVMTDVYADEGYAYANVSPLTRADDQSLLIDLMFDVEQGPQVSVERINIAGNTKTRDKVIRREMKLVEGDLYSASKLKRSKARINNLGFFEAVDVSTSAGTSDSLMNVDVSVKERPTGTFSVGAGYSSVDGAVFQGSVTQENFMGRGWRMNAAASIGGVSTTYQLGLTDPYFLDSRWTLGFEVYKTEREWDDFSRDALGFAVKAGHPVGEYSRLYATYRLEDKEIYDVSPFASNTIRSQEGKSLSSSITTSFKYNTTDNRLDPSSGTDLELTWKLAGLGGDERFSKYIADARYFYPWLWDTVFSVHGQLGYVHSLEDEDVPLDEMFYLGGIYSIRGFDSREVGPRDFNGDYIGGDTEAFANLEYIFPIQKDIGFKGVLFFDVGNAWGDDFFGEDDEPFGSWRYSAGGGIRWMSPLGPMRFEYGYNLDARPHESDTKFDFTIGRFF
jgi:outer membrane protein insertion porin family